MIVLSNHGEDRIVERMGLPKKAVKRQFKLALERGYVQGDTKGNLNKWLTSVALHMPRDAHNVVLYNSYVFIYSKQNGDDVLITVLPVPANLNNKLKDYIKSK